MDKQYKRQKAYNAREGIETLDDAGVSADEASVRKHTMLERALRRIGLILNQKLFLIVRKHTMLERALRRFGDSLQFSRLEVRSESIQCSRGH